MNKIEPVELLKNPDVVREIHRHLWVESEKAGYDVGLDWAAEDWMNRYAQSWIDCHMPGQEISAPITSVQSPPAKAPDEHRQIDGKDGTPAEIKKRRAKSYINF